MTEQAVRDERDERDEHSAPPAPARRRRVDRPLLAVCAVLAIGLVLVIRGVLVGVTGDDRVPLPEAVESVMPVPDAVQALSQTNVFVDLAANHTGVLQIDGIEIPTVNVAELQAGPGEQVDLPPVTIFEAGNATLTFTPSEEAPIEEFASGRHEVRLVYWRIDEGRERAKSFTWTFNVV